MLEISKVWLGKWDEEEMGRRFERNESLRARSSISSKDSSHDGSFSLNSWEGITGGRKKAECFRQISGPFRYSNCLVSP